MTDIKLPALTRMRHTIQRLQPGQGLSLPLPASTSERLKMQMNATKAAFGLWGSGGYLTRTVGDRLEVIRKRVAPSPARGLLVSGGAGARTPG